MVVETSRFGKLEVDEAQIIKIDEGLLGFEDTKKFIVIDNNQETPFKWLQAVDNSELAFVVMEPFVIFPEYQFDLSEIDVQDLDLTKAEDALALIIITVPTDVKKISANLKAPIVINKSNKKGKQIILNKEEYPIKFYLFQE